MNANTRKMIQQELVGLDREIARSLRMAAFHRGDDESLVQIYASDADKLQAIRNAVAIGDLAEAGRLVSQLEFYVRCEIPNRLLNTIHEANA